MGSKTFQRILDLNKEEVKLRDQLTKVTDELYDLGWKMPRHPLPLKCGYHGVAATPLDIVKGKGIVCLDLVAGSGHSITILYVNAERLLVEDAFFGWPLEQLGVIPNPDGSWSEGRICIPNDPHKLLRAVSWLNYLGTDEAAKLLEFIEKHLQEHHGIPTGDVDEEGSSL